MHYETLFDELSCNERLRSEQPLHFMQTIRGIGKKLSPCSYFKTRAVHNTQANTHAHTRTQRPIFFSPAVEGVPAILEHNHLLHNTHARTYARTHTYTHTCTHTCTHTEKVQSQGLREPLSPTVQGVPALLKRLDLFREEVALSRSHRDSIPGY